MPVGYTLRGSASFRRDLIAMLQMIQMQLRRGEELLILDVPQIDIGPPCHVGDELPKTPVRIALAKLQKGFEEGPTRLVTHGSTSLMVGYLATSRFGKVWITSTGTVCPGMSFATRVARVTPSLIRSLPSLPR